MTRKKYILLIQFFSRTLGTIQVFFSESVTKILHSCKEDLEAIYSWTKKEMRNIFDAQLANAFLDGDFTIGYQGLVEQELKSL